VFTLLEKDEPSTKLVEAPALPARAERISKSELSATSTLLPERAGLALDGKESTYWTGGRFQEPGQSFEVALSAPRSIAALELVAPGRVMDVPVSFRLTAGVGAVDLGVVAEEPALRFHRAQIFAPETFVFRVVLPKPVTADRVRFAIEQPVPGSYFSIGELRLYGAPR
jgi:hypothetical protein